MARHAADAHALPSEASAAPGRTRQAGEPPRPGAAEPPAMLESTRVLRQFRIVFNAVKSHLQQVERRAGATGAQVWALHVVQQQPGLGIKDLAAAMNVRQPTASILVKALVQNGLLEARRESRDRRARQLRILAPGRDLLERVPGPVAGVLPDALAALDLATLQGLERHLGSLIRELGADDSAGALPLGRL
jgi:MarR family transcriptional regulator, organic hydroperoxide resistance regulator